MKKLNVGCGRDYLEGYVNLDISDKVGADIVCDIEQGFPFSEDEFNEVKCHNVLTQIKDQKSFVRVMNELWMITKPNTAGGKIIIRVPNAENICAWQDPMDSRRFTKETFSYMQFDHRRYFQYGKHYGFLPFRVILMEDNGKQMIFHLYPIKE